MIKSALSAASAALLAGVLLTPVPTMARQMQPQGSYLQSCSNVSVRGDNLSATCHDGGRGQRTSTLNISRCRGVDISNSNGLLVCGSQRGEFTGGGSNSSPGRPGGNQSGGNSGGGWGSGGGWSNSGRAPQGSYQNSCTDISVRSDRLYATCRDVGRNQRASSLDLNRCGGVDIINSNGLLACGSQRGQWEGNNGLGGGGNRPGWGNRQPSITVYKDSNFRGERATFQGEVSNLGPTGFNDEISSVEMRGPWEFCTDSNFRGSCQIFEGDVRNLGSTGFNDRISSMRPIRNNW